MTDPRASEAAVAAYEARVAAITEAVKDCRYCKAAKTRKADAERELRGQVALDRLFKVRRAAKSRGLCKRHDEAYRLAYVCSPVSETYWCS